MVENDSENFWESYLSGAQAINRFPSALDAGCEPFVDEGDGNATIASSHAASTVDGDISDIILIASWILVVSLHSLQDDIIVGLDLEGRTEGKVPFRIQIPETNESSLADLIANVTTSLDAVLSVVTNADSAKEQWNRISRSTQGCEGEVWDFSSCLQVVSQTSKSTPPQTQCCPLMVLCKRNNGSTTLVMNARESTYTKPVQQAMMVHFQRAITTLSSSDHVSINELDLLSDFDGDKLSGWAQNPDTVPSQPFLHQAIEEQARQRPLSVAIGQTDMVMTYGELNEGGHVLSQHLRDQASSQGAKIGNIAIVFAKSAFAVLAMLAVLKAGGGKAASSLLIDKLHFNEQY